MDAEKTLKHMTWGEKIALCEGGSYWHTRRLPRLGIPAVMLCDGPHGLRMQEKRADMLGVHASRPATCFPAAALTGCSWDPALLAEIGKAIGEEARANGVGMVLGPGLNIKRSPLCGRNFEYYSEDPLLSGKLAAGFVRGGQETGVGFCLKHFAANSQEYLRHSSDSEMDERTLREIYLRGFEIAVREGNPAAVMNSYNKLCGVYTGADRRLLTDILRGEWGFDGFVVTDWGALPDRVAAFKAGCDLCMPGGANFQHAAALAALAKGTLDKRDVDASCLRVLRFIEHASAWEPLPCDMDAHHKLAKRAAVESAVLLKNVGALPLRGTACLIGHMAKQMRYQGAGSSHIVPARLMQPCDAMPHPFAEGCRADGSTTPELLEDAKKLAAACETPVVFAGLPPHAESEGFDRQDMRLPEGTNKLIMAVASVNPNTVVVLLCGSPVETPWLDKVNALLWLGLPGEAGGEAIADLLYGNANPSGKLTESWPICYDDAVVSAYSGTRDAEYRESVYVGYRYYDTARKPVRFPFGFGLSYTRFAYADLRVEGDMVSVTVENVGKLPGGEVAQLYLRPPEGGLFRPARELRGFEKVFLAPGEKRRVTFSLTERDFAVWQDGWVVSGGVYTVELGGLTAPLAVPGEPVPAPAWQAGSWYETLRGTPSHEEWETLLGRTFTSVPAVKGEFTMDTTLLEAEETSPFARFVCGCVRFYLRLRYRDPNDPAYRMLLGSSLQSSIRSVAINAALPEWCIRLFLRLANGRNRRREHKKAGEKTP